MAPNLSLSRLLPAARSLYSPRLPIRNPALLPRRTPIASFTTSRRSAAKTADEKIEEIQEQYATAKDEFEIAYEETEKMSVYAEEDRKAAREELDKLHAMFQAATRDDDEIRGRIGQRIRELDNAVRNMEELAQNQD